jgi:hypothetical protein
VSGWVRGENIVLEPGRSVGASVCLMGTWDHTSETLAGTFEWRQVSLRFTAPPSGSVMIGCRLGYWGNLASGKAWFDDLMITSTAQVRLEEPRVTPDLQVQFLLLAEPQRSYVVESTPDFLRWRRVRSLTNQHPVVEISDPFLPAASRLFYRARRL